MGYATVYEHESRDIGLNQRFCGTYETMLHRLAATKCAKNSGHYPIPLHNRMLFKKIAHDRQMCAVKPFYHPTKKTKTRLYKQPGFIKKMSNSTYFCGAALSPQPHVGAVLPAAGSAAGDSASTGLSECMFICCGPSAHCGTCKPIRAS